MKEILQKEYKVPARWLLLSIFIILISIFYYYAIISTKNEEALNSSILVGLATGLTIALIQFLLTWREQRQIDKFENMGVIDILPARDDRKIYGEIISKTSERLWIMGNTATRLLQHFAVKGHTSNPDEKNLINALDRNVEVKILIANENELTSEDEKSNFINTKKRLEELKSEHKNFYFKYYSHMPNHSIFIFDNECFLGSTFKNLQSKETPVIRMKTNSEFAIKYINAFEYEWNEAD